MRWRKRMERKIQNLTFEVAGLREDARVRRVRLGAIAKCEVCEHLDFLGDMVHLGDVVGRDTEQTFTCGTTPIFAHRRCVPGTEHDRRKEE